MNPIELKKARAVYNSGGNITSFLREELGETENTSKIIEIAYDLQAGTYIEHVSKNTDLVKAYAQELRSMIEPHVTPNSSILDIGTGELTTLSFIFENSDKMPNEVYAFDISWSRLWKGMEFWKNMVKSTSVHLYPFVADIKKIPLATNSIDIVTSSHALEPNGKNLPILLSELFRICRGKLVLFEPSYELNSEEGKSRMDRLGYIKGIEKEAELLGGKVVDVRLIKNVINPINPTACYVIEPPEHEACNEVNSIDNFSIPGTNYRLKRDHDFLVSAETGLVFPILQGIPVLKESSAILASGLFF